MPKRIRSIDEAGWLDNRHIGILLPYTTSKGACSLAESICRIIAAKSTPPKFTIYTYPHNWFSDNGKEQSAQLHPQNPQGKTQDSEASEQSIQPILSHPLPVWKRAMDITGSLFALIILSPLMLSVAVVIKIVSRGPVFFKQQRIGYMGREFTMWKFRTIKVGSDISVHRKYVSKLINNSANNDESSTKPMTKLDEELEVIPFGRILRQTCIDELPQLFNVLIGQMSLVGPRPPIPYEVDAYLHWHKERLDAVPGMTGLWQVSGKNKLTFREMTCLDVQYWRNKSLWLDIKILLMTPGVILSQIKNSLGSKRL